MESVACSLPVLNGPSRFWGIYCTIGLTAYETGISITTVLGIFVFLGIQYEVLRELCSNIIKHAPKYSKFQSSIALQKSQTEIVMSNSMSTIPDEERSGRGLESRRRKLNLIGGEIDHEVDGDTWIVYARIPLTMVSPDKAATESMEDNEHEKYSPRKRGKTRSVECQGEQMARKEHKAQK